MATLSHAESGRLYSWWWDSHISPKNSKWLQENLTDMDIKVKSMIKLIEEDADSFRKRAEMYYRKRPELMKLVEEFYRAYRALAERYDHATGALRQAHRTMAEAFPDQIPLMLPDESPNGSSSIDVEPRTPEMLRHDRAFFDGNDSLKGALDMSSDSNSFKRNGVFSGENGTTNGEEETQEKFSNGWARRGLDFQNVEGKSPRDKVQQEVHLLSEENQNLKNQIMHESERADKAEAELRNLEGTISKLESEKEAVSLQYQLSLEKISRLEAVISRIQKDYKKLNDEMLVETSKPRTVEDRCHQLEKENQSLQMKLGLLTETTKKQQEELDIKREELEKLNISLKQERARSMQAEKVRLSLEKLHSQSQEEVRVLRLEFQNWVEKSMNVKMSKVGLEEEMQRLKKEIGRLNELTCSSALKIKSLQGEISLLEESKRKLEGEVVLHFEEKKFLQQEVLSIKADKKDLERRHNELTAQIGAVNSNVVSLQAMVKELRDGNVELKELCEKNEDERIQQLKSLKFMEKITEQNAIFENSLSKANVELEELREKVKALEESCETLHGKISMHISEKAVLVAQIEAIARNMEKLSEKNTLLENSLSDVNVELEGLRRKLNVLEVSCQSLHDQNSSLLSEKSTLVTQVEIISHSLENLESRYAGVEGKNLNLEREKDQIHHQVRELQHSLRIQKEEYETLMHSARSQLDDLERQICILQEKGELKEEELEMENHKIIHAQIEIFILQRILRDMKENNMLLSDKCQKYIETSRCQDELISDLKWESLRQQKMLKWVSQYSEQLVEGIHQVMRVLNIGKECQSPDDQHIKLILLQIEDLKTSILDAQDDNQHLVLEKSVILTLLEQCGLDLAELQSGKNVLEQESKTRFEELLVLQSEKHQLLELNEQLRQNVQACNQSEEVLKAEMVILCKNLADLQEAHSALLSDITNLIEENQSFSKKINDLSEENDTLEENNSALIAEMINFEYLYLVFRSYSVERAFELQLLRNDMNHLCGVSSGLEQEIASLNEKMGAVEIENMNLKESLVNLEECRRHLAILEDEVKTARNTCHELNLQIEMGKNLLVQKDMELLQVNHNFQAAQDKNAELSGKVEGLMMDVDDAKVAREELEKKNLTLLECNICRDHEIADLHQTTDALNRQLVKLSEEVEELKKREKHLTAELDDGIEEVKYCEVEIETLLNDIHITKIHAANFEEKMLELLVTCERLEISSMIQKEMFYEEITRRSVYENQLKEKLDTLDGENKGLKEELSAYFPLILSLGDLVTSLERRILPLANHSLRNQEKQDGSQPLQQKKSNEEGNYDHQALSSFGIFELQKLHAKVNALEEVVIDTLSHLEHDGCVSKTTLQAPVRESEGLKSKGTIDLEEASIGKDIILHLKKKEETGNLKRDNSEICQEKSEQMMKDIQLDHVLSSSQFEKGVGSRAPGPIGRDEARDQMMELWETIGCNKMDKPSPVTSESDLVCHQIEAVEEEKNVCPSSRLAAEKELSIDKLIDKTETHQERSGSISERLSSDAQRLSILQKSAKELKKDMETSELSIAPASFEYKKVRSQLKEAEAAILQLIDTNSKLTKKAEKLSSSSNSLVFEQIDEMGNNSERKISGLTQSGSEKIGRLELELQKVEYIWLKLKEEHDYKQARAAERRTRVLLRDYLYGRRESPRQKKVHCCACIRPTTKDE